MPLIKGGSLLPHARNPTTIPLLSPRAAFGCLLAECMSQIIAGSRTQVKVPQYWVDLILRCKNPVPAERPTFAQIAEDLAHQNKTSLMDTMLEGRETARRESVLLHNILPPRVAVRCPPSRLG